jgi:acetyl-CoA C-acetyltransferase
MMATQNIQLGVRDVMVAGGFESMSNAPFLVPRKNPFYGNMTAKDSIVSDGLFDVYNQVAMGVCAEHTAEKHSITREEQDDFCLSSYTRAEESWKAGLFNDEIAPVTIKGKKGDTIVKEDDDYKGLLKEKFRGIKSPFKQGGSVTAANSPGLNDGGAAVVMASKAAVEKDGLKPLARVLGESNLCAVLCQMLI